MEMLKEMRMRLQYDGELDLCRDLEHYIALVPTLKDDELDAYICTLSKLRHYLFENFKPFFRKQI